MMKRIIGRSVFSFGRGLCICFGGCGLLVSPGLAQVNGPGPSPSSDFDIVLNLPGDEADITGASFESIGGVVGQTTQLNVGDDGTVGPGFHALSGSELNIRGGAVDNFFTANSGSEVNISGGAIGVEFEANSGSVVSVSGGSVRGGFDALSGSEVNISGGGFDQFFEASSGSEVNISGGNFGRNFRALPGSDVELIGGEFRFNGVDFGGGAIPLMSENDVFTGTLADGSAFIFYGFELNPDTPVSFKVGDILAGVTLTVVDLPQIDTTPIVIDTPITRGSAGLRAGQELTVIAGGDLGDDLAVVDATLNVEAGAVGDFADVANSVVNISGGTVGDDFHAYSGSEVNISGGAVGESLMHCLAVR